MVDYALNELMQPIYHAVRGSWPAVRLRPDLQRVADAGVACNGERIYLQSHAPARQGQAAAMDQFTADRWVNDVLLASVLPWSDPAWRPDVLAQGLRLAQRLLPEFAALTAYPVQAVIRLQDAPPAADPELRWAAGSLHVCQLAQGRDDARVHLSAYAQPVLVITQTLA
jgi:hypothetical protein